MSKKQQKADASPENEYRSLTGHDYVNVDGQNVRVEAGDKIVGMPESSLRHEIDAGNIEEFVARHTENVRTPEEEAEVAEVQGVRTRREGGEIKMKEVDQ